MLQRISLFLRCAAIGKWLNSRNQYVCYLLRNNNMSANNLKFQGERVFFLFAVAALEWEKMLEDNVGVIRKMFLLIMQIDHETWSRKSEWSMDILK